MSASHKDHDARGWLPVRVYAEAMGHELKRNMHKGSWKGADPMALAEDCLYHLAKLMHAIEVGDKTAILEYGADVGNMAMMAVDQADALDVDLLVEDGKPPPEYDPDATWTEVFPALRDALPALMDTILPGTSHRRAVQMALAKVLAAENGDAPLDPETPIIPSD